MMPLRLLLRFALLSLAFTSAVQAAGTLVSGPMLGYQSHREVLIWVETQGAKSVVLEYQLKGQPETAQRLTKNRPRVTPAGVQPMKFVLPLLAPASNYEYSVSIDGVKQTFPYPLVFHTRTQWEYRTPPPDFKFIFGSCAYLNDPPYDRPGKPYGQGTEIFGAMARSGADFMIWGGDNWYLREADFSSESGIWSRYSHDRATPDLQPLYAAMPHYATWDDHDYGSNDANKSFEFKDVTLAAFKAYWGNATWGEADNPGVYGKFFWGDAAFFLMDNRWYRDDDHLEPSAATGMKTQYGARQRDWLKQSLLAAQTLGHFKWKFIVTGGQVITDFGGWSETFAYYPEERADLIKFIVEHKITGVVILSGDVHFTELARKKISGSQWLYELTSSPFSAGPSTGAKKERAADPHRVEGTQVVDVNYCTLGLSGAKDARVLTIACHDRTGATLWERTIAESELK
ncbi:MAG: alkaline phosphatase family protein [Verrucomicrobia bacterium]|nr:alkaline phosphatase family protein [Verrucomicrobiota bacterium]